MLNGNTVILGQMVNDRRLTLLVRNGKRKHIFVLKISLHIVDLTNFSSQLRKCLFTKPAIYRGRKCYLTDISVIEDIIFHNEPQF